RTAVQPARAKPERAVILRQVPPRPDDFQPPSAETLQHMREFSQCMRQHGVTSWPDPKPNGTFPIRGTPLEAIAAYTGHLDQALMDARMACVQYEVEWRGHAP